MNILMLETKAGSPNGIQVNNYSKGKKYDLVDKLAKAFVDEGWAEEYKEKSIQDAPENKAAKVPENKSARKRGKNK